MNNKLKIKNYLINLILIISSIYLPLLVFSFSNFYLKKGVIDRKYIMKEKVKVNKIKAIKDSTMPTFFPSAMLQLPNEPKIIPIGSIPLTDSYYCDEGYGLINFKTDRFGLRNNDQKWDNVLKETNIFVIGDSFIHGACVNDENTIPNVVQKSTNLNTLNLGMGGNQPYNYLATLKSIVEPIINNSEFKNIIIINFYSDDFYNRNYYGDIFHKDNKRLLSKLTSIINIDRNNKITPTKGYVNNLKSFIKNNYPITKDEMIAELNRKKKIFNFRESSFYQIITLSPLRNDLRFLMKNKKKTITYFYPTEIVINYLSELCKDKCDAYVSIIPSSNYWDPNFNFPYYKRKIIQLTSKENIVFIDGEEIIDKNNKEHYAPQGIHLSEIVFKKFGYFIGKKINLINKN